MELRRGAASRKNEVSDLAGRSGSDVEPWAKQTAVMHSKLGTESVLQVCSPYCLLLVQVFLLLPPLHL